VKEFGAAQSRTLSEDSIKNRKVDSSIKIRVNENSRFGSGASGLLFKFERYKYAG
jgi:hypothetical protein